MKTVRQTTSQKPAQPDDIALAEHELDSGAG